MLNLAPYEVEYCSYPDTKVKSPIIAKACQVECAVLKGQTCVFYKPDFQHFRPATPPPEEPIPVDIPVFEFTNNR